MQDFVWKPASVLLCLVFFFLFFFLPCEARGTFSQCGQYTYKTNGEEQEKEIKLHNLVLTDWGWEPGVPLQLRKRRGAGVGTSWSEWRPVAYRVCGEDRTTGRDHAGQCLHGHGNSPRHPWGAEPRLWGGLLWGQGGCAAQRLQGRQQGVWRLHERHQVHDGDDYDMMMIVIFFFFFFFSFFFCILS